MNLKKQQALSASTANIVGMQKTESTNSIQSLASTTSTAIVFSILKIFTHSSTNVGLMSRSTSLMTINQNNTAALSIKHSSSNSSLASSIINNNNKKSANTSMKLNSTTIEIDPELIKLKTIEVNDLNEQLRTALKNAKGVQTDADVMLAKENLTNAKNELKLLQKK